jgi:DNA-binding IclR family transcriptional regulator
MRLTRRNLDVLCAPSRVWVRDGRATVRTVAREAGITIAPAHDHLVALRRVGLVSMGDPGGLRPGEVR